MAGVRQEDLVGLTTHTWNVISYLGKSKYLCQCIKCGNQREIDNYSLKTRGGPKCSVCTGISVKGRIDLTDKVFGEWKVIKYYGDRFWICQCSCGKPRIVSGSDLRNGKTHSCGHSPGYKFIDFTNQSINEWYIEKYNIKTEKWICHCSCGQETRELTQYQLLSGNPASCGHSTTKFKDLTGKVFGNWKVLSKINFEGDNKTYWEVECLCTKHTRKILTSNVLISGASKSCGCLTNKLREDTTMERYGVRHTSQIGTLRTEEQLQAIYSKEQLRNYIELNFDHKPTLIELSDKLGISRGTVRDHIDRLNLGDLVSRGQDTVSGYEKHIRSMYPCKHCSDRTLLSGKEIDLYYPEKNFGIEFNGNYWHSDLKKKDSKYHQNKSLLAGQKGVQLFNIFEYEWNDTNKRKIILDILSSKLYGDRVNNIGARECEIRIVDYNTEREFLDKTHIQGYIPSSIALGLYYNNNIVGIMTFGRPRFQDSCDYELLRMSFELSTRISGGAEKMFKYFIKNYSVNSIVSYCNLAKFNGEVYYRLGFNLDGITEPSYIWINLQTYEVLTRYQTMKSALVKKGLGKSDQTESEIMEGLGYHRIYDCGNLRFLWKNSSQTSESQQIIKTKEDEL